MLVSRTPSQVDELAAPPESLDTSVTPVVGGELARHEFPCSAAELFGALILDTENSSQYLAPALAFALDALERTAVLSMPLDRSCVQSAIARLVAGASADVQAPALEAHAFRWPMRIVREFAPLGLTDGAWLSGLAYGSRLPDAVERPLQESLSLRMGGPGRSETSVQRYAELMRSLGMPAHSVVRWDFDETPPCAAISYEHALLGLSLSCFPRKFALELIGFNLWMSGVGPCPLLAGLSAELELSDASLRYFAHDARERIAELAQRAVVASLGPNTDETRIARVLRGFSAAHASYLRWQTAMVSGNVPFVPRDFVLECVRRKARFAIDHHREIKLRGETVAELLEAGGDAHERLLDHMAETASLITPGAPDKSPLITHALSLDGPMFDAFTIAEKQDLREWIGTLGQSHARVREPVALSGKYTPAVDAAALLAYCEQRYGQLTLAELSECLLHADREPLARHFVKARASVVCAKLAEAPELGAAGRYSERALVQLIDRSLERAVTDRGAALPLGAAERQLWFGPEAWRVTRDVRRHEWSELHWMASPRPSALPAPPAHAVYETSLAHALGQHPRDFMPELLGSALAFSVLRVLDPRAEAGGAEHAQAEADESLRRVLASALGYMRRVKDGSAPAVDATWQRLWSFFQWHLLRTLGSAAERDAQARLLEAAFLARPAASGEHCA